MARKVSVTKDMIRSAAFAIVQTEGMENLTARRLAEKAGCSTQPIFRTYENMQQLNQEVFGMAVDFFSDFYKQCQTQKRTDNKPFVEFGLAYIDFAMKEPKLFQTLFLSPQRYGRSLYELLNGSTGAFMKEMAKANQLGVRDPGELFMKMWIFIHGAACMVITGDYDLPQAETVRLLNECYEKNAS